MEFLSYINEEQFLMIQHKIRKHRIELENHAKHFQQIIKIWN